MSTRTFLSALLIGAIIRIALLPLPGTTDVNVWKIWGYSATTVGVSRMYGVGGSPPERRVLSLHGEDTTVNYPPLALYELGIVAAAYAAMYGTDFPDRPALTVFFKGAIVLADAALLALMVVAARRLSGGAAARRLALAYWLNPAPILMTAALGYVDSFFVLPAIGALFTAVSGWPFATGALVAAAILTKPQAIMIAPAVALAVVNARRPSPDAGSRLGLAMAAAALLSAVAILPVTAAGGLPNMVRALSRLTDQDMLSGNGCNLWWIVGYLLRAAYAVHDKGVWVAFTTPTKILAVSRFMALGYPNPRLVGTLCTLAAFGWALWIARHTRDVFLLAALAAFLVHAYATLSAQVHENHLFAAVPLLAFAAAARPRYIAVFAALSAIFALNLNLFYGISERVGYAVPRGITIVDATVVLAAANCAALVWHAAILRAECASGAPTPVHAAS